MDSNLQVFTYQENPISFYFGSDNRMINATQMTKSFKKKVGHFLSQKGTKEYITLLKKRYRDHDNGNNSNVLKVIQGGEPYLQGTWMCEKLALKFAAWLSPTFELWVYDRIQELLNKGVTQLPAHAEAVNTAAVVSADVVGALVEGLEQLKDKGSIELRLNILEDKVDFLENANVYRRINALEDKLENIMNEANDHYMDVAAYCTQRHVNCTEEQRALLEQRAKIMSQQKGFYLLKKQIDNQDVPIFHVTILETVVDAFLESKLKK